jgi:hypothetical protein
MHGVVSWSAASAASLGLFIAQPPPFYTSRLFGCDQLTRMGSLCCAGEDGGGRQFDVAAPAGQSAPKGCCSCEEKVEQTPCLP